MGLGRKISASSDRVRWEVTGVPETLLAEFSQRAAAIEERKEVLIPAFVASHGRPPTTTEIVKLRQRATLETRPTKEHRALGAMYRGVAQAGRALRRKSPPTRGSLGCGIATTCRSCERATWPTKSSPTWPGSRSVRSPSADPLSRGPMSWPRSIVSSTVSASPPPTTGLPWPSAPPSWPSGSPCLSRRLSCTSRRSVCAGPMGPAGSGPRGTRSTPPPSSSRPRPDSSRPRPDSSRPGEK